MGKSDPSGMWDEAIHGAKTQEFLSEFCGVRSANTRRWVAEGNLSVDKKYSSWVALPWCALGSTTGAPGGWMWYHFNRYAEDDGGWAYDRYGLPVWNPSELRFGPAQPDSRSMFAQDQLNRAVASWRAGDHKNGAIRVGMGLHALQDSWAHGNVGWRLVHAVDSANFLDKHIDNWGWDPPNNQNRRFGTKKQTVAYYKEFASRVK